MKRIELNPAWEGQEYVSPAVETVELTVEGVLCDSGDDSADNGYDPDNELGAI